MQRLGLNHGGYHGERIDIDAVGRQLREAALDRGWSVVEAECAPGRRLPFLTRAAKAGADAAPNLYLSAGIHGDEPAGPLTALDLLRSDALPRDANLWMCPCLNPSGFARGSRESADGLDLNRDYLTPASPEVCAHVAWLARQPRFGLTLLLHEDWEASGFYLYEVNPHGLPSVAEAIIEGVRPVCPIDPASVIDGRQTHSAGIIRPPLDPAARPQWPEAFWLFRHKTGLSYTVEAPSDYPLGVRVAALRAATLSAVAAYLGTGGGGGKG